ncbi:hypothetical protein RRG43_00785 [Mycoplasmopsis cynos]|uniref:hypothetical protein n=1 Tax=Mycoplasmopsis cynos TaxID=171284 RepID=UPI002AFDF230|nr:hypothetical protein [Mycoplasmopsis cynos]WQQ15352.1 hypothetical protein RRG43_03300 [Mycoplasmopsis cynos]WQQ15618.1 hypothetical protein RRG43_00785 [Mycoplasmopsis cynos]
MNFFKDEKVLNRILKEYFAKKERKNKYNEELDFFVPEWKAKDQKQCLEQNFKNLWNKIFWLLLDEFCESKEQKEQIILEILNHKLLFKWNEVKNWIKVDENTYENPLYKNNLFIIKINMDNSKYDEKNFFAPREFPKKIKWEWYDYAVLINKDKSIRKKVFWDIQNSNPDFFKSKTLQELLLKNNVIDKLNIHPRFSLEELKEHKEYAKIKTKCASYIQQKFSILNSIKKFEQNYHHKAKCYEDLKHMTLKATNKAEATSFAETFRTFEIDPNSNFQIIENLSNEFKKIKWFLLNEFNKDLSLRFRKIDNLKNYGSKVKGIYFPHAENITINVNQHQPNDVPHIQSFMHEYAHHIDYKLGKKIDEANIILPFSMSNPEFKELEDIYIQKFNEIDDFNGSKSYLTQSEEIFARGFERYLCEIGFNSSFNKDKEHLDISKQDVFEYLDYSTKQRFFKMYEDIFNIQEKMLNQKEMMDKISFSSIKKNKKELINYVQMSLFDASEAKSEPDFNLDEFLYNTGFQKDVEKLETFKNYLNDNKVFSYQKWYENVEKDIKKFGMLSQYLDTKEVREFLFKNIDKKFDETKYLKYDQYDPTQKTVGDVNINEYYKSYVKECYHLPESNKYDFFNLLKQHKAIKQQKVHPKIEGQII